MASDIDRLVRYAERVKKLNDLNKKIEGEESYDSVEISISPQAVITIRWTNNEIIDMDTRTIQFSRIDTLDERARKKIERRQKKLDENNKINLK